MPVFELRKENEQIRFVPGADATVTVFSYDLADASKSRNITLSVQIARDCWKDLLDRGFVRNS